MAAWGEERPAARDHFAGWVQGLPAGQEWFPWLSRQRLAATIAKMRERGWLADVAEILHAVADRPCWQPWLAAVDATLAGKDASSLSDAKAVEIFQRLAKRLPGKK